MSTITRELAKLFRKITNSEIDAEGNAHVVLSPADSLLINNARIALASLEAEPVAWKVAFKLEGQPGSNCDKIFESRPAMNNVVSLHELGGFIVNVTPLYTAPQPPTSSERAELENYRNAHAVPGEAVSDDCPAFIKYDVSEVDEAWARGFNACRAAMLQGKADGTLTNEGTIPATQFKPVADLYGITSPTGSETSFTFDAVEARDFIDGGWTCQEYVELERFQDAMTNHSVDANEKAKAEPVSNRDELPAKCWCHTCRPVAMNDMRFVVCPECGNKRCPHANDHRNACTGSNVPGQEGSAYPAAPQQEADNG